jgi:hypothetical protein
MIPINNFQTNCSKQVTPFFTLQDQITTHLFKILTRIHLIPIALEAIMRERTMTSCEMR